MTPFENLSSACRRSAGFTLIELMTTVLHRGNPAVRCHALLQRLHTGSADAYSGFRPGIQPRLCARVKRSSATPESLSRRPPADGKNGWTVTVGAAVLGSHEAFTGLTLTGPVGGWVYNSSGRLAAVPTPFSISASGSSAVPRCVSVDLSGLPGNATGSCRCAA
ncbi:GspH/FimT family pseudopilin [Cupriavidus basilensis]